MSGPLTQSELRFINLVASRRLHGEDPEPARDLADALAGLDAAAGWRRAAKLAAALLARDVFPSAPAETALLALTCQLRRDGFDLLAPQGAVVGMIEGLRTGSADEDTVARWLEDRAVPRGAG